MAIKKYLKTKWLNTSYFVSFVYNSFIDDDCTYRASALAFTSLLAVVPLMTVSLAILSAFPVFENMRDPLQNFVFDNFVPATGKIVQNYLQQFVSQVSSLSIFGVAFLIVTALLLMFTIERSMNKIWKIPKHRHGVAAFLLYWAILSLTPVLLGLSLAASSYLASLPMLKNNYAPSLLFQLLPIILSLTGFTFLYVVVPNQPVNLRHGLGGALVATFLFETAKIGFAYYLTSYNTYALLYGAFATVPIFFVWVYWVWVITLLGAEISYALSIHRKQLYGKELPGFVHALLWLEKLWHAQKRGQGLNMQELVNASHHPYLIDPNEMISLLMSNNLIHLTADNRYMLSIDTSKVTLSDLAGFLPYRLPIIEDIKSIEVSNRAYWQEIIAKQQQTIQDNIAIKLDQFFYKK